MSIFVLYKPMLKQRFIFFLLISSLAGMAQKSDSVRFISFHQTEYELKELQKKMFFSKKENERFEANKTFIKILLK
jgi:hypothetical protein